MTAIITSRTKVFDAQQFRSSFVSGPDTHYLFVGKTLTWSNDTVPDLPVDSLALDLQSRRDMLGLKRIQSTDTSLGIVNRTWSSGSFYDMYRHDYDGTVAGVNISTGVATLPASLFDANFYVITSDFNIFKCLYNGGGVASTVMPTGTSANQFATADGYAQFGRKT